MSQIFVVINGARNKCISTKVNDTVATIYERFDQISSTDSYVIHQGRLVGLDALVENGQTYHVVPKVLGGKGGFGSMLRALGAQIEKTTNREACRDLSGRRMRDVNNEQKLREWVAKAAEREREREQRRRERWERRRAEPRHNFDDPDYVKQKMQVTESLEDALQQGLQKASCSAGCPLPVASRKRKSDEPGPSSSAKKRFEWLGEGISSSDLESESDNEADKEQDSLAADNGAASSPVHDTHSDSGVESTVEVKVKESPMDVDSDSSGKDSAVNVEPGSANDVQPGLMLTDSSTDAPAHSSAVEQKSSDPEPFDPSTVDLMSYSSIEELESLGLDALKSVLMARGMKCGGTLRQRAERLWAVRGIPPDQIDRSLLAKPTRGKGNKK